MNESQQTTPEGGPEANPESKIAQPEGHAREARDILAGILARMDLPAEIDVHDEADRITLEIKSQDTERVVGRKGQVLDALQHVVAKMLYRGRSQDEEGRPLKPLTIDADGYRARHVERLQTLALRMAEKAVRSGQVVAINPMPAHDRRVMHLALAEMTSVTTRSEGDGDLRHMLIVPVPGAVLPPGTPEMTPSDGPNDEG